MNRKNTVAQCHRQLKVLHQLAGGLEYIHQKKLIHRDVKPFENVLIWVDSGQKKVVMKWADFDLVNRSTKEEVTPSVDQTGAPIIGMPLKYCRSKSKKKKMEQM